MRVVTIVVLIAASGMAVWNLWMLNHNEGSALLHSLALALNAMTVGALAVMAGDR
jgi:hypothetical protein